VQHPDTLTLAKARCEDLLRAGRSQGNPRITRTARVRHGLAVVLRAIATRLDPKIHSPPVAAASARRRLP
jgi:hypothetical protein